ncbi:MAG: tol-pal system-associated acyl-CoA thioesterase [Gammaproteobacteria bacterium]|nr:tol-pal system-associated acyl-CoA thioesterase [Gammaproteobacteria bacterium]
MVFLWPVRVYYEDTDSGGVVYYANYLKFLERARSEWLRALGFEQDQLLDQYGVIFAVRRVELEYLRPARFNDQLHATVEVMELGGASLTFKQQVVRLEQPVPWAGAAHKITTSELEQQGFTRVCSGVIQIACLDGQRLRPRRLPGHVADRLSVENRA